MRDNNVQEMIDNIQSDLNAIRHLVIVLGHELKEALRRLEAVEAMANSANRRG